jgi:hypothetical protein
MCLVCLHVNLLNFKGLQFKLDSKKLEDCYF